MVNLCAYFSKKLLARNLLSSLKNREKGMKFIIFLFAKLISVVPPLDIKPCGRLIYPTGLTSYKVQLLYSKYLTG